MSTLIVTAVGPGTSVQDGGRFGAQRYGLTPSGAVDRLALAAANRLVGNAPFAAAVEVELVLSSQSWYWMKGMLPPLPQWIAVCQPFGSEVSVLFQSE